MIHRYQIRVPEALNLSDIPDEMALKGWHMIRKHLSPSLLRHDVYNDFRENIRETLYSYLLRYDLCCGCPHCTSDIENQPWSLDPGRIRAIETDQVYHLISPHDIEDLLHQISLKSLELFDLVLSKEEKQRLLNVLHVAYGFVLGDYLYENPVCGIAEICQCSEPITFDPLTSVKTGT